MEKMEHKKVNDVNRICNVLLGAFKRQNLFVVKNEEVDVILFFDKNFLTLM